MTKIMSSSILKLSQPIRSTFFGELGVVTTAIGRGDGNGS